MNADFLRGRRTTSSSTASGSGFMMKNMHARRKKIWEADMPNQGCHHQMMQLRAIRNLFASPEEINDNPETAPSKRISDHFPRYNKVFYGRLIAQNIDIQTIRSECPHFDEWVASCMDENPDWGFRIPA